MILDEMMKDRKEQKRPTRTKKGSQFYTVTPKYKEEQEDDIDEDD